MPKNSKAKKLVLILATSALVTGASEKALEMILDWISCIHYSMQFWKNKRETVWALIDFVNKINVMTLAYAKQLGFHTQKTDFST